MGKTLLTAMLASVLLLFLEVVPVKLASVYGPHTPYLTVQIFLNPDAEFGALEAGGIDIVDWPLYSDWVAKFMGNAAIQMRYYAEIGDNKIEMNNQRWPTGVETPRILDAQTGTFKHYYGTSEWDDEAREFRQAIAHLTNKSRIETDFLKSYGVRQETAVPYPALAGWVNLTDLDSKGLIPACSQVEAAVHFDGAGFIQDPTYTNANPYYDPATPGSAQYLRVDPRYGGILQPLKFYIRMDDPLRRDSGWLLVADLRKAGIQVNAIEQERTVCYANVMALYDYNLYTGNWGDDIPLDLDMDFLYDLYHSSQYWGGSQTSSYGGLGYSADYDGFAHNESQDQGLSGLSQYGYIDTYAENVKYWTNLEDILNAALDFQKASAWLTPDIPLYAYTSAKAFRTGWTGVVNMEGYGVDNYWSFINMLNTDPTKDTIRYGFKSNLEGPNVLTSQWMWDVKAAGMVYDSLLGRNPYNLFEDFGWLAESWTTGTWAPEKMYALFTLRPDVKFHNGDPLTPADVKFSLEFAKDCGRGVSWRYSKLKDIGYVNTQAEEPSLGPLDVKVYFNKESYWLLHWAGFQPILNKNIWLAANATYGWGWGSPSFDPTLVRGYYPWESDVDSDGLTDMTEDGTGPWVWASYTPALAPISYATSIAFVANNPGREVYPDTPGKMVAPGFYLSQEYITDYLRWAFHLEGDVNDDGVVDGVDRGYLVNAFGTDMWDPLWMPWGTEFNKYNPLADVDSGTWNMATGVGTYGDGYIDCEEFWKLDINYLRTDDPPGMFSNLDTCSYDSPSYKADPQTESQNMAALGSTTTPRMYVDTYPPSGSGIILDESLRPGQIPVSGVTLINSYPSNYATNGSVTNPSYAYDKDQTTAAIYNIGANPYPGFTWFEVNTFNTTIPKPYYVLGIDVKMNYSVTLSGAQYRILLNVGSKYSTLQSWTSMQKATPSVKTWSGLSEPDDNVWDWTDISNIRLVVETRKTQSAGTGTFKEYESWASPPVDRLVISVGVENAKRLLSYQFSLKWSGPIFNVTKVAEGPFLKKGGETSFISRIDNGVKGNRTIAGCTLRNVSPTLLPPTTPRGLDGDGVLAYIEFQVENYGSSNLTLYRTKLKDSFDTKPTHITTDGYFSNKIPGDINSDKTVNVLDLYLLSKAYESTPSNFNWNQEADVNQDGAVNAIDLSLLSDNYGKTTP